jgi:hypothetical protein
MKGVEQNSTDIKKEKEKSESSKDVSMTSMGELYSSSQTISYDTLSESSLLSEKASTKRDSKRISSRSLLKKAIKKFMGNMTNREEAEGERKRRSDIFDRVSVERGKEKLLT